MNFAKLTDAQCKAYDDAIRYAVHRAARDKDSIKVCWLDDTFFVLDQGATMPDGAKVICIAQRWDDKTVQLRFDGAHSEFIGV